MDIDELVPEGMQNNLAIVDSFCKATAVTANYKPEEIEVSISGGADSDVMLDLMLRIPKGRDFRYVFFDTGMELGATKRHLDDLEKKYGIKIERIRAFQSVPQAVREYGQPFLSKYVSQNIEILQRENFDWSDRPYEELLEDFPKVGYALTWWTNGRCNPTRFSTSMFNINRHKYLKAFLIANPPPFKVSSKCCTYAKKKTAHKFEKENGIKLSVIGVRKAEGGIRAAGNACFTDAKNGNIAKYRPLFWYTESDKKAYVEAAGITHSDCYSVYGFKRTGCTGCPFGRKLFDANTVIEQYEPLMYRACQTVFREVYEYTKKYRAFKEKCKSSENRNIDLWEYGND